MKTFFGRRLREAIVVMVVFALTASLAFAEEKPDFAAVEKAFAERDLLFIQRLRPQAVELLTLDQRNAIALAAAKSLSIQDYIGAIGNDTIDRHFTKPSRENSPAEAECQKQWGINMSSASLLQNLAEKRKISDPRIVPLLIEAMDHPDRHFVGQRCYYALRALTARKSGDGYWARNVPDPILQAKVRAWWQEWWKKNKDRHPVFDAEMESAARADYMRLVQVIDEKLKPRFPALKFFEAPTIVRPVEVGPLFHMVYAPYNLAFSYTGGDEPVKIDRLPWIFISCRFQTEEIKDPKVFEEQYEPRKGLRDQVKICYSKAILGSDLIAEVKVASEDEELVKAMASVFDPEPAPKAAEAKGP